MTNLEPILFKGIKVDAIVCWDNFDGISCYKCCNVWVGKIMTSLFLEIVCFFCHLDISMWVFPKIGVPPNHPF